MKMMDKWNQTVEIGDKAIVSDVRHVFLRKGKGIFGTVRHEGRSVKVFAIGNQCWREVA